MNYCQSPCIDEVKSLALNIGFDAVGIATALPVSETETAVRQNWVNNGHHASMSYMERYPDLRADPRLLLDGCKSIIMLASSYYSDKSSPIIARYALGDDYHDVLRQKVEPITSLLNKSGFQTRICVDTAPLAERYWAVQAGIGFVGLNSMLIVPGVGSRVFLCAILTDAPLQPDKPCELSCDQCGLCLKACPNKAISSDKTVDARRCLSYLTIEHREEFEPGTNLHGRLYGCDICQDVCPHNKNCRPLHFEQFSPRPEVIGLTANEAATMTQQKFSMIFRGSPIKRAKLAGLVRNAKNYSASKSSTSGFDGGTSRELISQSI